MKKYTCSIADNVSFSSEDIQRLKKLVNVVFTYDKSRVLTTEKELIKNIGVAEIAITDTLVSLTDKLIKSCPNLKLLVRSGTSSEGLSFPLLQSKLPICTVDDYASESTAEFVFAQILELNRQVYSINQYVKLGGQDVYEIQGEEIAGKTMGIIGAGAVAKSIMPIAKGFGLNLRIYTKNPNKKRAVKLRIEKFNTLNEVLSQSDIIVCAVRLDPTVYHDSNFLIDKSEFDIVKKNCLLINISDSLNTINLIELQKSLLGKKIKGAAIDLHPSSIEEKFGIEGLKLIRLPNILVTHNSAFSTKESIRRLKKNTIDIVEQFVNHRPLKTLNV